MMIGVWMSLPLGDISHVVQLVDILLAGPLISAIRQELIIVLTRIVTRIKEIFEIIEADGIGAALQSGTDCAETVSKQQT